MQCNALPAKITSNIDRLSRNFLWGSSDNKKKLHLVGWSKVTRPKKEGGLGIQAAKAKNIALLAKLNWRIATEPNSLWAKVLTQKYRTPRRLLNPRIPFRTCSVTWSAIRKGELIFKKGSKWIVGRDSGLSLWYDKWLDKGELRSLIEGPLSRGEEHVQLKNVVSFSGWDWRGCTFNLPEQLLLEVKATPISFSAQNFDRITWSSNPSGNFELKEAYKLARMEEIDKPSCRFNGEWIWKVQTIPKILCFIWQCYYNSIPVRSVLAGRGMEVPISCLLCDKGPESVLHVLRDCCAAREFWNSFPPPFPANVFYETQLVDWLRLNCGSMKNYAAANLNWGIVFSFGIWNLWLRRNGVVFRGVRPIRNVREEVISKATEFAYVGINSKRAQTHQLIQVHWCRPPLHWCKVNSDGSALGQPGLAGGGGLIRNDKGDWIRGYMRAIGCTTSVAAELWALRDGIRLCIALKIPAVIFELDAKLIVDLLQKREGNPNGIGTLVSDCKAGLQEIPMVQIQHCYREANKCADSLARRGAYLSQEFVVLLDPPTEVDFLLRLDSAGACYERLVSVCNAVC